VSKQTIAMKAAALRPMFRGEELQLVELWNRISAGELDETMPAGALRMQTGLFEQRTLAEMEEAELETTGPKIPSVRTDGGSELSHLPTLGAGVPAIAA
jgi:hypothetical protein